MSHKLAIFFSPPCILRQVPSVAGLASRSFLQPVYNLGSSEVVRVAVANISKS